MGVLLKTGHPDPRVSTWRQVIHLLVSRDTWRVFWWTQKILWWTLKTLWPFLRDINLLYGKKLDSRKQHYCKYQTFWPWKVAINQGVLNLYAYIYFLAYLLVHTFFTFLKTSLFKNQIVITGPSDLLCGDIFLWFFQVSLWFQNKLNTKNMYSSLLFILKALSLHT